jgi:hypothetical protein
MPRRRRPAHRAPGGLNCSIWQAFPDAIADDPSPRRRAIQQLFLERLDGFSTTARLRNACLRAGLLNGLAPTTQAIELSTVLRTIASRRYE